MRDAAEALRDFQHVRSGVSEREVLRLLFMSQRDNENRNYIFTMTHLIHPLKKNKNQHNSVCMCTLFGIRSRKIFGTNLAYMSPLIML